MKLVKVTNYFPDAESDAELKGFILFHPSTHSILFERFPSLGSRSSDFLPPSLAAAFSFVCWFLLLSLLLLTFKHGSILVFCPRTSSFLHLLPIPHRDGHRVKYHGYAHGLYISSSTLDTSLEQWTWTSSGFLDFSTWIFERDPKFITSNTELLVFSPNLLSITVKLTSSFWVLKSTSLGSFLTPDFLSLPIPMKFWRLSFQDVRTEFDPFCLLQCRQPELSHAHLSPRLFQ